MPRELHLAAAKQGLLGVAFPEEVGGGGGDLLDSVDLQEAMFEAGASSGLMAGAVHLAASRCRTSRLVRQRRPHRPVRAADAGRREDRLARHHRARRRLRRRRHPHHRRLDGDGEPLRRQRRQDVHHQRGARRLRDHRGAHRRPWPRRRLAAGRRGRDARLHRRPVAAQDGLALLGHRRAVVRRRPGPGRQPGRRREHRLRPDRRAVRGRADRPRRARLRDRRPLARPDRGVLPGAARPSASR